MTDSLLGRRGSRLATAAAALILLAGCAAPATEPAVQAAPTAPASTSTARTEHPAPEPTPTTSSAAAATERPESALSAAPKQEKVQEPILPESPPVTVTIPSLGVQSQLLRLGLQNNGTLEVPPGDPGSPAGWYIHSPTPGERGPAVILGHVNAYGNGPGVFAGLRELKAGDTIEVDREDGTTAVFTVDRAEAYSKDTFPTETVYGNTAGSELRLITCDGYDSDTGRFDDNYVVYAKLVT
ncbi:class F sortase [Arthrobacter crystallopoietes]|jgi:sortase (surface protein transpeptidase)|uniref:class F sortase n=1 Tax=Crystallibacter crystallopoietes TaxID=37928 RepID=UPI000941CD21|nr:class F sortase [Arthrobacter crystallopoietes]AUI50896.1 class F sortase [Arthrobacter crystallopoietes]